MASILKVQDEEYYIQIESSVRNGEDILELSEGAIKVIDAIMKSSEMLDEIIKPAQALTEEELLQAERLFVIRLKMFEAIYAASPTSMKPTLKRNIKSDSRDLKKIRVGLRRIKSDIKAQTNFQNILMQSLFLETAKARAKTGEIKV